MIRWFPGWLALASVALALLLGAAAAPVTPAWAASPAGSPPPEIATHFTPEDVARGRAYMGGRYGFFAAGILLRIAALAFLIVTPASAMLRSLAVRLSPAHPSVAVAIYIALLVVLAELLTLPLGYYVGFVREHAFGVSNQNAAAWFADRLKAAAISGALAVLLGSGLLLLWRRYPGRWVLPAWICAGLVLVALVALAPVVIDPLFNTIRPLRDSALRERVLALADRAGIAVEQVYEADASRRTKKGNAYFTGLGATKRIVLYDNLVTRSDPAAVQLVVAHEMGHWTHAHIWQGVALALVGMGVALWCAARVLAWAADRRAFHLTGPADVAGLPVFVLVLFVLNLVGLPIQSAISRHFERQADWTSLELTRDPDAFVRAEVDLARSNLADLVPPRPVVWLLYTHPPVAERIRMAEAFARERGASSAGSESRSPDGRGM
jgi:STE24 endopeptidase